MIIKLGPSHTEYHVDAVCRLAEAEGLKPVVEYGSLITVICFIGTFNGRYQAIMDQVRTMDSVEDVIKVSAPYKLASLLEHRERTVVNIGENVHIGDSEIALIAGPCAIESAERLDDIAREVRSAGANILRGGAFKPRTSPYAFRGGGEEALKILRDTGKKYGMATVTEVMDTRQVPLVEKYADMFQIGARNMQNFNLLDEVGDTHKPVLLKRGMSATIEDLLMSAEYILARGNRNVVLCERGIRTFETSTRNTFDISAVPNLHEKTHLPVVVDPSHATGRPELIPSMALAGVAAGADGVHIEVHNAPKEALSDGPQALLPAQYNELVAQMRKVAEAVGRVIQ